MSTPQDPSSPTSHADAHGSPGAQARVNGIVRMLWPLLLGGVAVGWLVRAAWPAPAMPPALAAAWLAVLAATLGYGLWRGRHRLENYVKGARGEEETARALLSLPSDYRVFHAVQLGGAGRETECDHIVCGPTGVYAIETKHWSGQVEIRDGRVRLNGREPERPPLTQVKETVSAAKRILSAEGLADLPVQGVLCFVGNPLGKDSSGTDGVIVCNVRALAKTLRDSVERPLPSAIIDRTAAIFAARLW